MGSVLDKIVFKDKYEDIQSSANILWQIQETDIDGNPVQLKEFLAIDTKCVLFVNVATK